MFRRTAKYKFAFTTWTRCPESSPWWAASRFVICVIFTSLTSFLSYSAQEVEPGQKNLRMMSRSCTISGLPHWLQGSVSFLLFILVVVTFRGLSFGVLIVLVPLALKEHTTIWKKRRQFVKSTKKKQSNASTHAVIATGPCNSCIIPLFLSVLSLPLPSQKRHFTWTGFCMNSIALFSTTKRILLSWTLGGVQGSI